MADFTVPEETRMLLDGIRAFVHAEVDPREEALREELQHPYDHDGRYVAPILAAKREIRMASSQAGYYPMFVPEEAGGGGAAVQGGAGVFGKGAWDDSRDPCQQEEAG